MRSPRVISFYSSPAALTPVGDDYGARYLPHQSSPSSTSLILLQSQENPLRVTVPTAPTQQEHCRPLPQVAAMLHGPMPCAEKTPEAAFNRDSGFGRGSTNSVS